MTPIDHCAKSWNVSWVCPREANKAAGKKPNVPNHISSRTLPAWLAVQWCTWEIVAAKHERNSSRRQESARRQTYIVPTLSVIFLCSSDKYFVASPKSMILISEALCCGVLNMMFSSFTVDGLGHEHKHMSTCRELDVPKCYDAVPPLPTYNRDGRLPCRANSPRPKELDEW